jgi:hypothetical protein
VVRYGLTPEEYLNSTQPMMRYYQEEHYEARREQEVFMAHLFAALINVVLGAFSSKHEPINAFTLCPWLRRDDDGE